METEYKVQEIRDGEWKDLWYPAESLKIASLTMAILKENKPIQGFRVIKRTTEIVNTALE